MPYKQLLYNTQVLQLVPLDFCFLSFKHNFVHSILFDSLIISFYNTTKYLKTLYTQQIFVYR